MFRAPPPQIAEIPSPNETKITMMDNAYNTAFNFPLAFVLLLFKTYLSLLCRHAGKSTLACPPVHHREASRSTSIWLAVAVGRLGQRSLSS